MKRLISIILTTFLCGAAGAQTEPAEVTVNPRNIEAQSRDYYYYNFGNVRVNWSRYADIYLRNTGYEPLYIRGVFIAGTAFWAWSYCPKVLYPGQSCLTRVEFRPWYEGAFSGTLRYQFPHGSIWVDLYGWGTRY